jgi:serine/threonine-protein kinase
LPVQVGRYRIEGEIGRGGMGVVLRAHDGAFNRTLAVKMLLKGHQDRPESKQRFLEEAQVLGQLQHPGIPPVHDLGELSDGRPFFAMKLIKGRTLAELLRERPSPAHDLPRFLTIFDHLCQTLAYAHSRGILHRDLKPSNVMVGAFGEVQVMDWGLAKVLGSERKSETGIQSEEMSTIATVRSASAESSTQDGAVLGTPAYMAPEQARGEIDQLDERCDVFGLGAILCALLTGQPPYVASSKAEVYSLAARADLTEALARLEACGADAELVALARACLAPELRERPRHAGEVADCVAAYQAQVQERLKQAEVDRARALEERKRRKLTLALAAAVLLLVLAGGSGAWLVQQQHAADMARQQEAEGKARDRMDQARALLQTAWQTADFARLADARAQADQAIEIAASASDAVQQEAARLQEEIKTRISAAQKNRALLAALLDVIQPRETQTYEKGEKGVMMAVALPSAEEQFASAFRRWNAGLDLDRTPLEKVVTLLQAQPEPVVQEVVAGLDEWALQRRRKGRPEAEWRRLLEIAERLDRNDRRKEVRRLLTSSPQKRTKATATQWDKVRADLRQLATKVDVTREPVLGLLSLARVLYAFGEERTAEKLLRAAVAVHRGEALLLFNLGQLLEQKKPPQLAEAIECYRAACAVRPQLGVALGLALVEAKRADEGEAVFRDLVRREPNNPEMYYYLGIALREQKKLDAAVAAYHKALALRPDYASAYNNLGNALHDQKKLDAAVAAYHKALGLRPDYARAFYNLGLTLRAQKKPEEAVAAYQKATTLRPDYAAAYYCLGNALYDQKKLGEAVAAYQKVIALRPNFAEAYHNLGIALYQQKKLDEAAAAYHKALALRPDYAEAYYSLGNTFATQKKLDAAVAAYQKAIALRPDDAEAYNNLGIALRQQKKLDKAVAAFCKAKELLPGHPLIRNNLQQTERWLELDKKLPAVLAGKEVPPTAPECLEMADFCAHYRHYYVAAARFLSDALSSKPSLAANTLARVRYDAACYAALAAAGKGEDAAKLKDQDRSRLRQQALVWLKENLKWYTEQIEGADAQMRAALQKTLQHWQQDTDLVSVREPKELTRLPATERASWQQLWADVEKLRQKVSGSSP